MNNIIGVLLFVIVTGVLTQKFSKKVRIICILLPIVIMAMFRDVSVGNDSGSYAFLYERIANGWPISLLSDRYEVGYLYLNKLLTFFSDNYIFLFSVTSLITYLILGRFIYLYSRSVTMSVIIFFGLRYFDISFTGIRQFMAISILLLSYDFILSREPVKFAVTVILASLFHTVAIFFLITYFLKDVKFNKKNITLFLTLLFGSLILVPTLIKITLSFFPKYTSYVERSLLDTEPKLSLILNLVVLLFILLFSIFANQGKIQNRTLPSLINGKKESFNNLFFLHNQLLLSIFFMFLSLEIAMFQRVKNIFAIFIVIYIPELVDRLATKELRFIAYVIVVFLFAIYIIGIHILRPEWQSTFPYRFG